MARLPKEPPSSEITPEGLYRGRREFLKNAALFTGTAAALGGGLWSLVRKGGRADAPEPVADVPPLPSPAGTATASEAPKLSPYSTDEPPTPTEQANMNNGPTADTADDGKIHVIPVAAAALTVAAFGPSRSRTGRSSPRRPSTSLRT